MSSSFSSLFSYDIIIFFVFRGLFNLVNHNEHMGDLDRIKFIIRTVVLLKCLQGATYYHA